MIRDAEGLYHKCDVFTWTESSIVDSDSCCGMLETFTPDGPRRDRLELNKNS